MPKFNPSRILITGGAGFIGSALIRHLISHTECEVVNVDCLTYAANLDAIAEVSQSPRYVHENVDISHHDEMSRVFRDHQPHAVFHLAAESHVDRSIANAKSFIQTNVVGSYVLLEVATRYWKDTLDSAAEAFRFVHVSTDEVYGALDEGESPFTEETPYDPTSPYSASKASSDHLVRAWHRTYGLRQ